MFYIYYSDPEGYDSFGPLVKESKVTNPDEINQTGIELHQTGDSDAARLHYLAALLVCPNYPPALANLAHVASEKNQLQVAVTLLRRVVDLAPSDGNQWNNYGNVLMRLAHFNEARVALEAAVQFCPDNSATWHNLALLEYRRGNQDLALEFIQKVIDLGSASPRVLEDKSHMLLAKGDDLPAALEIYDQRWHTLIHQEPWDFHITEWQGESLDGETILIHAEQGFGDTIMTSRFAKNLVKRGANVVLGVPASLVRLYEQQEWPHVEVIDLTKITAEDAENFDFHSPLFSVMRWLGVQRDDINPEPYLTPPNIVIPPISSSDSFNIGICWASGIRHNEHDWRRRHSPLDFWLPLAENPRVQLHSLCVDVEAREEVVSLGAEPIVSQRRFEDWAETAAFVSKLDLVISVDTAMVHLAGALGRPTWMLSQFTPCWRWWDLKKGLGTPWYGSVEIFGQKSPKGWRDQLSLVTSELERLLAKGRPT